jgi:hypothetical protein
MADAGLKARVDRLLSGDFRVDDVTRLFLYARNRCDGRESVQEIGDFVAHHEERIKGIVTRETKDWFMTARVMASAIMGTPLDVNRFPADFPEFLSASFRRIGPSIKRAGVSRSEARRLLPQLLKKFVSNSDGTLAISPLHTSKERAVIEVLSTRLISRPAFTATKLFTDFSETLRSNGLLTKHEQRQFEALKPAILLFAASVMHNCVIQIGNGLTCKLTASTRGPADTIVVNAPVPTIANPQIFFSSSIFSTDLNSKDHCDEALSGMTEPWDLDLEVTGAKKLAKLG